MHFHRNQALKKLATILYTKCVSALLCVLHAVFYLPVKRRQPTLAVENMVAFGGMVVLYCM